MSVSPSLSAAFGPDVAPHGLRQDCEPQDLLSFSDASAGDPLPHSMDVFHVDLPIEVSGRPIAYLERVWGAQDPIRP